MKRGGKPFQSKLGQYAELIREMRGRRKSYQEIAQFLNEKHGLSVDRTTIWNFVKVRSRPRKVVTMIDTIVPKTDPISVLKAKPSVEQKKPLFTFDENKPLTLKTS